MNLIFYDDSTVYGGQQLMGIKAAEALLVIGDIVSFIYHVNNIRLEKELKALSLQYDNLIIFPTSIKSNRLQALRLFFEWIDILKILNYIKKTKASIVLAVQGDIEIGSKCLLACRIANVRVISYIPYAHSAKAKGLKLAFFRDLISKIIYRLPNAFITSTASVSREIVHLSGRPVAVVHDGIKNIHEMNRNLLNKDDLREFFNIPKEKFIAAVVARVQFRSNLEQ